MTRHSTIRLVISPFSDLSLTFSFCRSGMSPSLGRPFVLAADAGQRDEPTQLSGLCSRVRRSGESFIFPIDPTSNLLLAGRFFCVSRSSFASCILRTVRQDGTRSHFFPPRLNGRSYIRKNFIHASSHLLIPYRMSGRSFFFFYLTYVPITMTRTPQQSSPVLL